MHVGNSGGFREWQGLLGRRPDWESAHPGQRVPAKGGCPVTHPDLVRGGQSVQPADPRRARDGRARLLGLFHAHNQAATANELLQMFGQTRCPSCGAHFAVADALA